jgi:hypothetical protein
MKMVKVTLKPESSGKKLYLFPTPEALYVWLCAMEHGETVQVPDITELVLEPDGFAEVELRGFEYSYEDGGCRRLDLIRLGLAQQPKNAAGVLVTTHSGWVSGGLLPLRPYEDADIEVRPLLEADSRLQLQVLFADEDNAEDEDE